MSKELAIKHDAYGYTIYYPGGGEVPATLSGRYTAQHLAQAAIDAYVSIKRVRRSKNADSEDKRRAE